MSANIVNPNASRFVKMPVPTLQAIVDHLAAQPWAVANPLIQQINGCPFIDDPPAAPAEAPPAAPPAPPGGA